MECTGLDLRDTSIAWGLLKNLQATGVPLTTAPLISPDGEVESAIKMSALFNNSFASISRSEKKTAMSKALDKARKEKEREPDKPDDLGTYNAPFCRTELENETKKGSGARQSDC